MANTQDTSGGRNVSPEKASERSKHAAETRREHNPDAFKEMGEKGASARHSKSKEEESEIARKAAETRKGQDPDAFRKMGEKGGHGKSGTSGSNA